MYRNTKIATCSYCGNRSALVLDEGRHELVCPACGAPLHEIKAMPVSRSQQGESRRAGPAPKAGAHPPRGVPPYRWSDAERARKPKPYKKRKKRKSLVKKVFEEAFDLIEDIFD